MPALLLIGIPLAVIILFVGIMNLPDDEPKTEMLEEDSTPVKKTVAKKKKK